MNPDFTSIEEKWRKAWREAGIFEADPTPGKPKFFLTVAYPYPNSPQHIGHGRTYTLTDVYARFKRMKGFNVLFPMAFHYTGTPIVAMVKRLREGDRELRRLFTETYGVPEEALREFDDPLKMARYFHEEIKTGMDEMGYSIDWRREFTTVDPQYSRFIQWQFEKLREKGYVKRGSHPVGWCPSCSGPVGQHDTRGDVEPEIGEFTLLYFKTGDETILPAATLRPETVFGAVNLWVNPEAVYVKLKVDGETWIVSQPTAGKLKLQGRSVGEVEDRIRGSKLTGIKASNPATGEPIPILPAEFVDPTHGTGVVMSVPAHAPYDYVALQEAKTRGETGGLPVDRKLLEAVKVKPVIQVEGLSDIPARDVVEEYGIESQEDPKLKDATQKIYRIEYHRGFMRREIPVYGGLPVPEARARIVEDLSRRNLASTIYEILNHPVYCRCGALCTVKLLEDQWFIDYGNPEWKRKVHSLIDEMKIKPQILKTEFHNVVDWLREKACARRVGLGTRLPWDPDWIIESLSDSTIYMVYYLISKYVNLHRLKPDQLTAGFFDYTLLGEGNPETVAESTGIPRETLEEIRREIEYFYPLDSRHSGRDLVNNHLAFFLFNHVAVFPRRYWPRQIVVNGSVLMEGKKMSKSLGNIIPLRKAVKTYGADALRLTVLSSAGLLQDADFKHSVALSLRNWLQRFLEEASNLREAPELEEVEDKLERIDRWILSRLQTRIEESAKALEELEVREDVQTVVYGLDEDISWYRARTSVKPGREKIVQAVLKEIYKTRALLLAPLAPFTAEEAWHILGGEGFASTERYPEPNPKLRDEKLEASEEAVRNLISDTREVLRVLKKPPSHIYYYLAAPYKWKVARYASKLVAEGTPDPGKLIEAVRGDPELKGDGKTLQAAYTILREASKLGRSNILKLTRIELEDLLQAVEDAKTFIEKEFRCRVDVYVEGEPDIYDPAGRSARALPWKPAIYVE